MKTTKRQQVELKGNRRIFVICEALSLQSCLAKKGCGWPHLVAGFREFKVEKNLKPCHGAQILFMKILCRRSSSWPQISADFTNHVDTNTSALSGSRAKSQRSEETSNISWKHLGEGGGERPRKCLQSSNLMYNVALFRNRGSEDSGVPMCTLF